MRKSAKPRDFPTKDELIAGGRLDLVQAIVAHGGWFAYGWDLDDYETRGTDDDEEEKRLRTDSIGSALPQTSLVSVKDDDPSADWLDKDIFQQHRSSSATTGSPSSSSSDRPIERIVGEENGIEGILSRLEQERSLSFMVGSKKKEVDAGETLPNGNIKSNENFLNGDPSDDYTYLMDQSASDMRNGSKEPGSPAGSCQNQIDLHLQYLESEGQQSSLKELHRLSDAWEFQENEIMNARDQLRSRRAKLAVLEGKMALEIIEAQKILEEKQKRIDAARRAVCLLCTVYVVWPNSASEVLLAGSFDGWSTQRRMERSSTGIFSLCLTLYPGQYEIKFIVDGAWKVDPLRPIVYNNGFENNFLIISSAHRVL